MFTTVCVQLLLTPNNIGILPLTRSITTCFIFCFSSAVNVGVSAEQEQLMKLMEQAKTVEDTMSIQSRLTDVRYELESYMSQLKVYDNQVDYDTVNISIQEVKNETPTGELSIGQKMLNGLENSLRAIAESAKNLCIWFVASIPYFVILFAVIFAVVSIIKKIRKKK